jgi:hypothetical protein
MGRPRGSRNKNSGQKAKVSVVKARTQATGQAKRGRKPRAEMATVIYEDAKVRIEREPLNYCVTTKNPRNVGYYTSIEGILNHMINEEIGDAIGDKEGMVKAIAEFKVYAKAITDAVDRKVVEVLG